MSGNTKSREIGSNQLGVHEKLHSLVERYKSTQFARPISEHTQRAFDEVLPWLTQGSSELILDACCGVGQSTVTLAKQFPSAKVLGVDKSVHRLEKHHAYEAEACNYQLLRADLNDFWRLLAQHNIVFTKHYILYPNPYPKATQIQKRWYASAIMPYLMQLSPCLELRSNWKLYLKEFAIAAQSYGFNGTVVNIGPHVEPLTPFEKKYIQSNQTCYQLILEKRYD